MLPLLFEVVESPLSFNLGVFQANVVAGNGGRPGSYKKQRPFIEVGLQNVIVWEGEGMGG